MSTSFSIFYLLDHPVYEHDVNSARHKKIMNKIAKIRDFLFLGSCQVSNDERLLRSYGITLVINVTLEVPVSGFHGISYMRVKVIDSPESEISKHFDQITERIEEERRHGGKVLVHCVAGISRSASVVLAYLMKYQHMRLVDAHAYVKARRQFVRPNWGFWKQLIEYERKLFRVNSVSMIHNPALGWMPSVYRNETVNMVW